MRGKHGHSVKSLNVIRTWTCSLAPAFHASLLPSFFPSFIHSLIHRPIHSFSRHLFGYCSVPDTTLVTESGRTVPAKHPQLRLELPAEGGGREGLRAHLARATAPCSVQWGRRGRRGISPFSLSLRRQHGVHCPPERPWQVLLRAASPAGAALSAGSPG